MKTDEQILKDHARGRSTQMTTTESIKARMDAAVERQEAEKAALYRADGSKRYSDEEHAEREAAINREFREQMDAIEADIEGSFAAAEEAILAAEGADPTAALTTEELERANAKSAFVADDCSSLPLDSLKKRCRAVLASGDRATMFLYVHHAARRADSEEGIAVVGLRGAVEALRAKADPEGKKRAERAREALEEARRLREEAYYRRRGVKDAYGLYSQQAYGDIAQRFGERIG